MAPRAVRHGALVYAAVGPGDWDGGKEESCERNPGGVPLAF